VPKDGEAVKTLSAEKGRPGLGAGGAAARKRVAVETYARNEAALRRTARKYSICDDDAEDALQRGLEILLHKAPTEEPRGLIKWMQTVVKHEALTIRKERERMLGTPAVPAGEPEPECGDWISLLPATSDGPAERAERREAVARSREALQALKPQELRALTLLAEGYSYVEIGEITGYSKTKVNRCLTEGRERFRAMVSRGEDGSRCAEVRPLLSAFCDGEARAEEVAELREHLRACPRCRATLRTYRAAPAAAAALCPTLPVARSLLERAHEAVAGLAGRLGGGGEAASQVAAGGGAGGAGMAALAKVAAVCAGTAGTAAACVAGGLVPLPLNLGPEQARPPALERRQAEALVPAVPTPAVEYAPEQASAEPKPKPAKPPADDAASDPVRQQAPEEAEPVAAEPAPVSTGDPVEYVPPPAPEPEPAPEPAPAPVASSGGGNPAGEFGP
jgi:RNA polymerase sigma factor (sigma-70 family)